MGGVGYGNRNEMQKVQQIERRRCVNEFKSKMEFALEMSKDGNFHGLLSSLCCKKIYRYCCNVDGSIDVKEA